MKLAVDGNSPGTRAWVQAAWVVGLALVAAAYLYQVALYWNYVNDDAYITFRYSHSLLHGQGPYFNPGEPVEGYTNLSWMLLMTLVMALAGPGAVPLAAKLLGAGFGLAAVLLSFGLVRTLIRDRMEGEQAPWIWGLAAAGLVAAAPAFALNCVSGLETALFAFLLVAGAFLTVQESGRGGWLGSGLVFGLAVWTRPEGAVLFAACWLGRALAFLTGEQGAHPRRRLALVANGAVVTGMFLSQLVFRLLAYDGEWLPNTYYAKAGGFWALGAWNYLFRGVLEPVFGVAGIGAAAAGLGLARRVVRPLLPVVTLAVAGMLMPLVTGSGWMPGYRLSVCYLPLVAVVVAAGWAGLLDRLPALRRWLPAALVPLALVTLWMLQESARQRFFGYVETRALGYRTGHAALAGHLAGRARKDDTIALMDIGMVGYRCPDQRILDISGLTDRTIAKSPGTFLDKRYDPAYLLDQKPEFVVLVVTAPGESYRPPPADTRFRFWTRVESRIYHHPEFQAHYRRRDPPGGDRWTDHLARKLGAEAVFPHAHPGHYYLLALFSRFGG